VGVGQDGVNVGSGCADITRRSSCSLPSARVLGAEDAYPLTLVLGRVASPYRHLGDVQGPGCGRAFWDGRALGQHKPNAGSALTVGPHWAIGGRRYERLAVALLRSSFGSRVRRSRPPGPPGGGDARAVVLSASAQPRAPNDMGADEVFGRAV